MPPTTDPAARELAAVEAADATPTPAPAPVDVRVTGAVSVTERPARTITTDQVPVTLTPTQVVNAVLSRARLRLTARGAAVFIGGPSVTVGTGYMLDLGESIDLDARCAVHAVTAEPGSASLHILSEHNDG